METILKLKKIFRLGYLPNRGKEQYSFVSNSANVTNCFEHACFNLTNEQLKDFNENDLKNFFALPVLANVDLSREEMFDAVKKEIAKTGLKVKKTAENLKENEWNVAMYFSNYDIDVHFLLQEKNGGWSGKFGQSQKTDHYSFLPLKLVGVLTDYKLYKVFTIENPYLSKENKEEMTR